LAAGGVYSTPPDSLAGFKGPTSKGGKGRGDLAPFWKHFKPCHVSTTLLTEEPLSQAEPTSLNLYF